MGDKVRILVAQFHALAAFADTTVTHWFAPPLLGLSGNCNYQHGFYYKIKSYYVGILLYKLPL